MIKYDLSDEVESIYLVQISCWIRRPSKGAAPGCGGEERAKQSIRAVVSLLHLCFMGQDGENQVLDAIRQNIPLL